jgi:anti-anti-sigma regulatory factor
VQIVSVIDRAARQWVRVSLSGEIETATSTAILRSALGALLRARPKGISLNLGGADSLGDGGLRELRRAVLQAAEDGVWFEIVNAPLPVHRRLSTDPVLSTVLEAYAWRRPGERAQLAGVRG